MNAIEIRELTSEELEEEILRVREELFRLKFRAAYEELENPSLLRTLRRDLARLNTIQHERETGAGAKGDG
ncbi:MAG: 50S ribosomal protein L29 [Gemmatimonadota bacterium]